MANYESGTPDPAIPVTWTDTPLVKQRTRVKKVHLVEIRDALEALDGHIHVFNTHNSGAELPNVNVTWIVPNVDIIQGTTRVEAAPVNEVIGYIKDFDDHYHNVPHYSADSTQYDLNPTFEDDPIISYVTFIKATAWEEFRDHLESYAAHTHIVCCECECTCTCTCTCECQCTCECTCDFEI